MPNRTEATTRKPRQQPPGDYRYCACSRLHSLTGVLRVIAFHENAVYVKTSLRF